MPGFIVHLGATVLCAHGGQAQPTAPFPRVLVSGMPVVTMASPYVIAGCPFVRARRQRAVRDGAVGRRRRRACSPAACPCCCRRARRSVLPTGNARSIVLVTQTASQRRCETRRLSAPLRQRGRTALADDRRSHPRPDRAGAVHRAGRARATGPTFGSGLMQLVFAPNSDELAAATQLLVQGALQQWLGDLIEVDAVQVEAEDSTLRVTVQYVDPTHAAARDRHCSRRE